jgi:predicted dehydrogenase
MKKAHNITLLGAGLIGTFYTMSILGQRSRDHIRTICALTDGEAEAFARKWGIPRWTANMKKAVEDPETDIVIVGVPNYLHKKAIRLAARAGKPVLCTKPLARNAREALEILEVVDKAGVSPAISKTLSILPRP